MEGGSSDPPHRQDRLVRDSRRRHAIPPRLRFATNNQYVASTSSPPHNNFLPNPVIDFRYAASVIKDPTSLRTKACTKNGLIKKMIDAEFCLGELLSSLSEILLDLVNNRVARKLIAHCFRKLKASHTTAPLAYKMVQDCLDLATDKSGYLLLNECIPLMEETHQRSVLFIIWKHAPYLAQHCYGTYVVQTVVSSTLYPKFTEEIVMKITSLFLVLSTQKEGSHLVERCITSSLTTKNAVKALVELKTAELKEIACNEFGNFVIQKAISHTKGSDQELHSMLRTALLPFLTDLKRRKFGRNVAYRLRES